MLEAGEQELVEVIFGHEAEYRFKYPLNRPLSVYESVCEQALTRSFRISGAFLAIHFVVNRTLAVAF